jgi:hypothetical protein
MPRSRKASARRLVLAAAALLASIAPAASSILAEAPLHAGHAHRVSADQGLCGEPMDEWHSPLINGCATGHEHGDEPPSWIEQAGYAVRYSGLFNTSPMENTHKHAAMKGFSARLDDVEVYFRVHAASNVLDRSARYHSYEAWARDPAGAVSHWQGWYDTGDPTPGSSGRPRRQPGRSFPRPVIEVVDQGAWDRAIRCEQWYTVSAPWSWEFGWTICGSTTLYYATETDEQDITNWRLTGSVGGTRRMEASWFASNPHPTGTFYATQFGEVVSGLNDARCSDTTTRYGSTYQNVCLEQFIAPTMKQVSFPNNALQKTYDTTGVRVPN